MTTTSTDARKAALFARTTTAVLVTSALTLDAKAPVDTTPEERLTRAWICDELEKRMGGIQDDEAFDALLDQGLSYLECLIATFPALAS